uniref:Sorting nexin 10a n=1 Tax=Seriola dumerili TaxID=41447 RepID=A0A3B4TK42_SERDU
MQSQQTTNCKTQHFISICVQNPRLHKDDLWHTHVDYEICLQTNSMCFRKKTSCVRRRYSEFVWLRHCLEQNALIINQIPALPPSGILPHPPPQVDSSMYFKGVSCVLHTPLLLSDSRLHLFLQSDLSITKIERCAHGKTRYTVAEAIQRSSRVYISGSEDKGSCDSDCERYGLCPAINPTSMKATIQLTSAESWNLSCYCRWLLMYHICCLVYVHVDILLC